jgi:hypothetical protein
VSAFHTAAQILFLRHHPREAMRADLFRPAIRIQVPRITESQLERRRPLELVRFACAGLELPVNHHVLIAELELDRRIIQRRIPGLIRCDQPTNHRALVDHR